MSILVIDKKTTNENISNYETLRKAKASYEYINDILKFSNTRMDTETSKELNNAADILKDLYEIVYSNMKNDPKERIDLQLNIKCPDCDDNLCISDIVDYSYLCQNCDKNFHDFEVDDKAWYLKDNYYLNSKMIEKVDISIISEYISCWNEGRPLPVTQSMIYAQDGNLFIAIDNTSNECYVEEFFEEDDVFKWFIFEDYEKKVDREDGYRIEK